MGFFPLEIRIHGEICWKYHYWLVVTGTMEFYDFPYIGNGMSSSQLTFTNSIIFQRGRWLNHQPVIHWTHLEMGVHQFDDLPIQSHRFIFRDFRNWRCLMIPFSYIFIWFLPTKAPPFFMGICYIFHDFPMVFQLWTTISHADFLSFPIYFIWFPIKSTVKA